MTDYLLAREGKTYIVSGFALESAPFVRVLAYQVGDDATGRGVPTAHAVGQHVSVGWAYTGPRTATYRASRFANVCHVEYDPSKPADLVLDFALTAPKCRKHTYWRSGAFCADYADGTRRLAVYEGDFLAGFIAETFTSGRPGDALPEVAQ